MRKELLSVVLILFLMFNAALAQKDSIAFDRGSRSYILHLPAGYTATKQFPLVVNLHGATSNALQQQTYAEMDAIADAEKFIVVYPEGINSSWNAGLNNFGIDDVGFIDALLDSLIANYSIDTRRIYCTGFSMGGCLTYKLACELGYRFAAVAPIAGLLSDTIYSNCNLARSMPVLHIHGTNDPVVLYDGLPGLFKGVEDLIQFWRSLDNCTNQPDTLEIPNINLDDQCNAELIKYSSCNSNSEIWFYKVHSGGHTWPDPAFNYPPLGNTNRDFDASQHIWNFFRRFSLPETTGIETEKKSAELNVYPNPAVSRISITHETPLQEVIITDMNGKVLLEAASGFESLQVSELKNGTYVIKAKTASGMKFSKIFIKQ